MVSSREVCASRGDEQHTDQLPIAPAQYRAALHQAQITSNHHCVAVACVDGWPSGDGVPVADRLTEEPRCAVEVWW